MALGSGFNLGIVRVGWGEHVRIAKALILPPEFWFNRSGGPGHLHSK